MPLFHLTRMPRLRAHLRSDAEDKRCPQPPEAHPPSQRCPPCRLALPLSPPARWLAAADCCQITAFWNCSVYHLPYAFTERIIDPTFPHCL